MGSLYIGENLLDSVAISYDTEDTPTAGSKKPLSSGGAFSALATKADLVDGKVPEGQLPEIGYSNEEALSNTTKAMYGLEETAVPNDVFKIIAPTVMATIVVTAPTGSTITATNGERTTTANEVGGTWTFYADKGTWTINGQYNSKLDSIVVIVTDVKQYDVELDFIYVYGAQWDGTSTTTWSRTDRAIDFVDPVPAINNGNGSSPFDDIMPWSGMVRVSDSECGELVAIPKFWYKWTKDGNTLKLQIADGPKDGFYVSPAHSDRGDGIGERDTVYIGRYHCATNSFKSQTGVKPQIPSRKGANDSIRALGSGIYSCDFQMLMTIWMLYLVEFADWNSQATIGYGIGNGSNVAKMGYTDSMLYHTGTTQSSRKTRGFGTQYRYIEGLWDNYFDWLLGCHYDSSGFYICRTLEAADEGTLVGKPLNGYPSAFNVSTLEGLEWVIYPTDNGGNSSTYTTDKWNYSSYSGIYFGGAYDYANGVDLGLFHIGNTSTSDGCACRLQKLP